MSQRSLTKDPALTARGKVVYGEQCASCHGANLEGQPNWRKRLPNGRLPAPPHDATGHTWHHSDRQLFAAMIPGYETDMPAYKDILSDPDIWAVLSYIESRWPPDIRQRQALSGPSGMRWRGRRRWRWARSRLLLSGTVPL